jgi:hypothetical protein
MHRLGRAAQYCMDMLNWMVHCWGIVPLTDMLSMINTKMMAEEDTPRRTASRPITTWHGSTRT